MKIILASKSPRRKEILSNLGLDFEIVTAETDEASDVTDPETLTQILSLRKAKDVEKLCPQKDTLIIACDTVVSLDGCILGKPHSRAEAVEMLKMLSGRRHTVTSGVSLIFNGKSVSGNENTDVYFGNMPDDFIEKYVSTGDPMDKAGAYAVQGLTSVYIDKLDGCYFNVVGLPVRRLVKLMKAIGIDPNDLIFK